MAGTWGPEDLRQQDPVTLKLTNPASVTVCTLGTSTPITLYTDETMATTASNPLATNVATDAPGLDVNGNAKFFAVPGKYTLLVDGRTYTEQVRPDIVETGSGTPGIVIADYNTGTGTYPTRASVTTNALQPVLWRGPNGTLATVGGAYATAIDLQFGY